MISSRIDAITKLPEDRKKEILPAPRSVKIELCASCDLKCFFCATHMNLRQKSMMDFDLYKRLVTEMRSDGVEELGLFYLGESMLYPKLSKAIEYAKYSVGFPYVFLTTNGRAATYERIYNCVNSGLDSLKFSLNAYNKQEYFTNTGVDCFGAVIDNIKSARKAIDDSEKETGHHCGLYVSTIMFDRDYDKFMQPVLDEILPYIDEHYWLPLYNQAGLTQGAHDKKSVAGNIGRIGSLREPLPCWALFTEGHVTFDGKLTGCCFDHNDKFTFGDLTKDSFMDCWNSEVAQKLRKANLAKDVTGTACESCVAYK